MNVWKRVLLSVALPSLFWASPIQAQTQSPLAETEQVYTYLVENHLNKPQPKQLVQGALKEVADQVAAAKKVQMRYYPEDDTLGEMESRLEEWQQAESLDWTTLNRWAIQGMLSTLNDPFTMFFTREQLRMFEADVDNESVGFGIRLRLVNGSLVVRDVIPDSPAALAGIQPGDYLFAADGVKLSGKTLDQVYELLRGEEGSESALTIYKPTQKQVKTLTLKRAVLEIPEAEGYRFSGDIGYISLATFGSEAGYQFRDKLRELTRGKAPLKGLVIDLRDNGGGYLSTARDIASLFMEEGLLMYTTNRNGIEVETWVHNGQDVSYPVRILVNEQTASASELLAGALRDHGIARLVGTKTFGKGSAQQVVMLENGDALKITLHEYFTPNHTVVNHVGLKPDIESADDVGQVVSALVSLGVKQIELRQSYPDEVMINGVPFFLSSPLFSTDAKGAVSIRGSVLAALAGESGKANDSFVAVEPYVRQGKATLGKQGGQITFTFVRN